MKHGIIDRKAFLAATLLMACLNSSAQDPTQEKVTVLGVKPMDKSMEEVLVSTVELAPGMAVKPHRHHAQVFVYMLQGEAVMQVKGGPETVLKPGDTFYERPEDIHTVTRNRSRTETAKFLVYMLKKKGASPVVPLSARQD